MTAFIYQLSTINQQPAGCAVDGFMLYSCQGGAFPGRFALNELNARLSIKLL